MTQEDQKKYPHSDVVWGDILQKTYFLPSIIVCF